MLFERQLRSVPMDEATGYISDNAREESHRTAFNLQGQSSDQDRVRELNRSINYMESKLSEPEWKGITLAISY